MAEESDKKDALRVICGGPGSGKTSATKVWAAELALAGHRVLYVPLHHLDIRGDAPDVQAMLWEYLFDLDVLPFDPLDTKEGEPRLLMLFDGLDELVMQGRAGQEVARSFIDAVASKVDRINEREDRLVQVALGGRDVVVEAARIADHRVLHVLPYHGHYSDRFKDPEKLLENESYGCDRWWQQFGEVTGDGYQSVPKPLKQPALADVTAQPLLNYLLALSYRRGKLDFSTPPNLNLIYRDLLDAVYERPWGPAAHPSQKVLSREEFDQLLDELGLAAWHGAGRTFTETQAEQACQQAGLGSQLSAFKEGARAGAISLLAAFYFRQAHKIEGERTFEFSHKSFGEYLMARRIVRQIEDTHEERVRNRANRQRGWSEEQALIKWVEFTGPTALDQALFGFLEREVELRGAELASEWQETLAELLSDQLKLGLPMHRMLDRLRPPTFQEMTRQARNSEEALLAVLYCCASVAEELSIVAWPNHRALASMLTRLSQMPNLAEECLGWLDASKQELPFVFFAFANLQNSNLEECNLFRADFFEANLFGANLMFAELADANLTDAFLAYASLLGATLEGANLDGVSLKGAVLEGTNLQKIRGLHSAHDLREVESWRGARIERKWVERLGLDAEKLGLEVVDDLRGGGGQAKFPTGMTRAPGAVRRIDRIPTIW